jgi:CBS domain containing-hemolysin-like protein
MTRATSLAIESLMGDDDEVLDDPIQEEIRTVVNEGEREGQIAGEAVDMIAGLIDLHRVEASEIMTPRTDIVMLPITTTIEVARREVAESGHSRIPVYGASRDDIVGILYAKDLLPYGADESRADLSSLQLRQPAYVRENKPVDVLLRDFRKGGVHIAIILDNYGGVAGLVTIEDVIEEIVGDIKDEYDEDEVPAIRMIDQTTSDVDARLDVESINEHLSIELPEGVDYDTIGGFVTSLLGRIPKTGESLSHENVHITVTDASDRTIRRLRIERIDASSATAS